MPESTGAHARRIEKHRSVIQTVSALLVELLLLVLVMGMKGRERGGGC